MQPVGSCKAGLGAALHGILGLEHRGRAVHGVHLERLLLICCFFTRQ